MNARFFALLIRLQRLDEALRFEQRRARPNALRIFDIRRVQRMVRHRLNRLTFGLVPPRTA
jgi:hypothetical protein